MRRSGASSFYGFDLQSSARVLVSVGGAVTDSYTFKAFGEEVAASGSTVNPLRYVGAYGYYRETAERYYVRARYYNSAIGRWNSRDQLDLQPAYQYVRNRPIQDADPSGLIAQKPSMRRRKCFIVSILGRTQLQPGLPNTLVGNIHQNVRAAGYKGLLSESEHGSTLVNPGNTLVPYQSIIDALAAYYSNPQRSMNHECECIWFVGYSWGGGQAMKVSAWMAATYPRVAQRLAATIDAINVTPARKDLSGFPMTTRIPSVAYHAHWYAEKRVVVKGANISPIAPGFSQFVPGSSHSSIQDMADKYAPVLFNQILALIDEWCEQEVPS
jgi:RHS repeat-associated protein